MLLLDAVPITSCHECVATLTLPLALFLILAETTVGGIATVVYLRLAGGVTPGLLRGRWYLVTPALPNRPLLRAIGVLVISLALQAGAVLVTLGEVGHGAGSLPHALSLSPVLSVLWALGSVILPLVAAGLAL